MASTLIESPKTISDGILAAPASQANSDARQLCINYMFISADKIGTGYIRNPETARRLEPHTLICLSMLLQHFDSINRC